MRCLHPGGGSPPAFAASRAPRSGAPGSVFRLRSCAAPTPAPAPGARPRLSGALVLPQCGAAPHPRARALSALHRSCAKRHRGRRESPARARPARAGSSSATPCRCALARPGRAFAVRGDRFFEVLVFLARDEADLPQGGELLLRLLHLVRQEISLAQVFARAAMARVELERATVVPEGGIELPGVAIGVTEEIVDVRVAIVLQERLVQALDGALPVLPFDRLLSRGVVGPCSRSRRVLLARIGLRSRDCDEEGCHDKRRAGRGAAHGAFSAAQAGTLSPRPARRARGRRSRRALRASRNTRAPSPGRRTPAPPWLRRG